MCAPNVSTTLFYAPACAPGYTLTTWAANADANAATVTLCTATGAAPAQPEPAGGDDDRRADGEPPGQDQRQAGQDEGRRHPRAEQKHPPERAAAAEGQGVDPVVEVQQIDG